MTRLTPAAVLATRIAAHEAATARAGAIEREHLFIGILSLDKVLKGDEGEETAQSGVAKEHAAIYRLLDITGLDATVLRRLMREALGTGSHTLPESAIHRSPECKRIYSRASALAGGKPAGCIHLFSAIMEAPGTVIGNVLAESRRCRAALRETDVLLPAADGSPLASRSCTNAFDFRKELTKSIADTRDLLEILPVSSHDYPLVQKALLRQTIDLALLCLDGGDRAGLVSALRDLAGMDSKVRDMLVSAPIDPDLATENGGVTGKETGDRIRSLLQGLDPTGADT